KGNIDQVSWVGFSPDGRTLGTSCHDGTLKLWSTASWTQAAVLWDPRLAEGIGFSPDGTRMFTARADGSIRVWHAAGMAEAEPQLITATHEHAAVEAEQTHDWAAAISHLDALISMKPAAAGLRERRGNACAWLGRWAQAKADFDRLAEL